MAGVALLVVAACLETSIVQVTVDDLAEIRMDPDSLDVPIGRSVQAHALTLDAANGLLVGVDVTWTSVGPTIASIDTDGLVTGEGSGTTQIVATSAGIADTAVVVVAPAPQLVLSTDAVEFTAQAGQPDPPPDVVDVTNGGVFPLVGLAVDSIVYVETTTGWLAAQLGAATAPTQLELTVTTAGITAVGFLHAVVWVSGVDADDSPASIDVQLEVQAGPAATIELNDGDGQTGEVGLALPTSPSVLVKDDFDNPVPGAVVTFAVTGGGGSVTGSPGTTDTNGIATVGSWILGQTKGANSLDATLTAVGTVSFTATGVPGPATHLQIVAGDGQSAVAGSAVTNSPQVAALDAFDNGVQGIDVVFSVTSGGGDITGGSQTTDAAGVATAGTWTLGTTAGTNTVDAVAASIPDTGTFTATGLPGGLNAIVLVAGDAQTDTVAATLPVQYTVRAEDINNNGIPGIPVSFAVTGGGGSITLLDTTDGNGVAVATRVLGTAPGTQTAQAAVGGVPPVDFTATATVGTPSKLVAVDGTGQSATVNTTVATAPTVQVTDKFDNPIAGYSVTFAAVNAGATISPSGAQVTAADGTASLTSWKLGTVAATESDTVWVTPSGGTVTPSPLEFTATANADLPNSIAVFSGDNQTAVTGTNVAQAPTVQVLDQYLNPVPSATVDFTTTGGSVGSASQSTNASGQAATTWAPDVAGGTMQPDGTFPDTLTATVQGTAINTLVLASARYSYPTHVQPVFDANCNGCHGGFMTRSNLLDQATGCDPSIVYVSSGGGILAEEQNSLVTRYINSMLPNPATCTGHSGGTWDGTTELQIIQAWVRNGAPNN